MKQSYAQVVTEHERLVILRILDELPSYTSNSSLLASLLGQYGLQASRDKVATEIHWLAEQGLVTVDTAADILIVKLTSRGSDVAQGKTSVPGVKRPGA